MDRMPRLVVHEQSTPWLRRYRYLPQSVPLTPVQWLIIHLVACGLSDKEIAYMLAMRSSTVKAQNCKTAGDLIKSISSKVKSP